MKKKASRPVVVRRSVFHDLTDEPCPRCRELVEKGRLHFESIMPLPKIAALAMDHSGHCCDDCRAADTLLKFGFPDFVAARISVSNDRREHLRLPNGMSQHLGLVAHGIMKPCSIDDLHSHREWLSKHGLDVIVEEDSE